MLVPGIPEPPEDPGIPFGVAPGTIGGFSGLCGGITTGGAGVGAEFPGSPSVVVSGGSVWETGPVEWVVVSVGLVLSRLAPTEAPRAGTFKARLPRNAKHSASRIFNRMDMSFSFLRPGLSRIYRLGYKIRKTRTPKMAEAGRDIFRPENEIENLALSNWGA